MCVDDLDLLVSVLICLWKKQIVCAYDVLLVLPVALGVSNMRLTIVCLHDVSILFNNYRCYVRVFCPQDLC